MTKQLSQQSQTRELGMRQNKSDHASRLCGENPPGSDCMAAIMYDLQSVIGEIQQFLTSFCDNWQQAQSESRQEPKTTNGDAEFYGDHEPPPSQTALTEQAALLTEAWLRLEAEQRELLHGQATEVQSPQHQPPQAKLEQSPTLQQRQPPERLTASISDHQLLSEFQILRQEIVAARTFTSAR